MSDFYIQKELLSSNTRTIVKDQDGRPIYLLVGKWGVRGDVLSLYQMNGEIAGSIKQKDFGVGSRFDLYLGYEKVGRMQRIFSFQQDIYYVHWLHWVVLGDIAAHHYTIHFRNQILMEMEEALTTFGDFYVLHVASDADAPLCICVAAILDYWLLNRGKKKLPFQRKQIDYDLGL